MSKKIIRFINCGCDVSHWCLYHLVEDGFVLGFFIAVLSFFLFLFLLNYFL